MDVILNKWHQTKTEMKKIADGNDDIKNLISLNDTIYQNPDKIINAIQSSEFFLCYFHYGIFGTNMPYPKKSMVMPNFMNTTNIRWDYTVSSDIVLRNQEGNISLRTNVLPSLSLSKNFNKKAYGSFSEQIDIEKLKPELVEDGNYLIENQTGKLIQAKFQRKEIVDNKLLYMKIQYEIISDSRTKEIIKKKELDVSVAETKKSNRISFIVD